MDDANDGAIDVERALIERAQQGDRVALGELCRRHGPTLYRSVLLPRLGSEAAAHDALAETYARVIEKVHLYRLHPAGIYPWLRTIAMHIAIDHIRARKRWTVLSTDDLERDLREQNEELGVDEALIAHRDLEAVRARVKQALATIHPRYRRAIELRILDERPRDEVAEALDVTPSTFDVLLHRAMKALRAALVAESDEAHAKDPKR